MELKSEKVEKENSGLKRWNIIYLDALRIK